jgi:hypothetical protein
MQPEPTTSARHDEIRSHICAAIGNIDASQISFERDPSTGKEYAKVELRDDQLQWALRGNGQCFRQAAMDLGIDIEV